MKLRRTSILALLSILGVASLCQAGGGPYQDLLRRLPGSANALVVADVPALRKSLGVTPGTALSTVDITSLPIMANQFVLGANIDLNQRRHIWSVAVCRLDRKLSIQDIAKTENEPVSQVAGASIVASPRNAFFVEMGPDLLACRTPANRQELKRWLTYQKTNQIPDIPEYLLQAANPADPALMVMALELADSLDQTAIRRGLDRSQVMASRPNPDYNAVAQTLAQAHGMTLTIRQGNPFNAELTVDFDCNTAAIRFFAKELLIETLQHAGLYVPDFDTWEPRLKERSIGIYGPLSVYSLRKCGTLIATPAPNPEAAAPSYQSMTPAQRTMAASKRYYQSVAQLLGDLRNEKSRTWRGLGSWYEQYANQISMLPTLDVDSQLVNFAGATTERLRSIGALMKGVAREQGQVSYNSYNGYYGSYVQGYGGEVTQAQAQYALSSEATAARAQLWEQVENATAEIRQQMTQKYMTQF